MCLHLIRFLLVLLNLNCFLWGGGVRGDHEEICYILFTWWNIILNVKLVLISPHHPLWTPLHAC